MTISRKIVLELLTKMDRNGSYSNILLDNTFSRAQLEPRDKAFAAAMFYGVLERKMTLDYIIRQYSSIEYDKISLEAIELLRMGLYQLMFMDSVTENAAVNESVELAPKNAKGFINAILRAFIRDGKMIRFGSLKGDAKLSIEYSCPKWLVKKWISQFGEEKTVEILKASLGRPPLFAKVNTMKCNADELIAALKKEKIEAKRNVILPDCVEIGKVQGIETTSAYRRGMFHVQDISSQLCCRLVKPVFNETVIDVCAAPGGKTFTMAQLMNNRGTVHSYDLYNGKVSLIEEGAKRLGLSIVKADVNDATIYNEKIPLADKVLCDVVCSGFGVIRRKPEIKYKSMKETEGISAVQRKIIETASRYVKLGGTLVYSTCTINREENDEVVDDFLKEHGEFAPVIVPIELEGMESSYKRTFLPSQTGGDGFFAATLRRVK